MKLLAVTVVTCAALGLAGCDRQRDELSSKPAGAGATRGEVPTGSTRSDVPMPVDRGQPQSAKTEKNPVQGQVDPKEAQQRRDFQQRGDGAGPRSPETTPRSGG